MSSSEFLRGECFSNADSDSDPGLSSVITVNLAETGTASGGGVDYSLGAGLNISDGHNQHYTVDDGVYDRR